MLAEAEASIAQFFASGILELRGKLGPVLWQFAPTKKFDAEDFEAFLKLLPRELEGRSIRHVVEVRHASFCEPAFVDLAKHYGTAICLAQSEKYPLIADVTADFVYLRLQQSEASSESGYTASELNHWAQRAKLWAQGGLPADLPYIVDASATKHERDCFIYFIAGAKERNPAAACALIERIRARSL